jgi:hypothetical protein
MESPPQFMVMPDIQRRAQFPFTMDCAKRFFGPFMKQSFNFAGMITSIVNGGTTINPSIRVSLLQSALPMICCPGIFVLR